MFTVTINEQQFPVLDLIINHQEEHQAQIEFSTTFYDEGPCAIYYNGILIANGIAIKIKTNKINTFKLQYPTTPKLDIPDAELSVQINHYEYYFASQLQILNHNRINGNHYTSEMNNPNVEMIIKKEQCISITHITTPPTNTGVNVIIKADWPYHNTGSINFGCNQLRTQMPFAIAKNLPCTDQSIGSNTWIIKNEIKCEKVETEPYGMPSEGLQNIFMILSIILIVGWEHQYMVHETVHTQIHNGSEKYQDVHFTVKPDFYNQPLWKPNKCYQRNDIVSYSYRIWKCLHDNIQSERFDDNDWLEQSTDREQSYFTTPAGRKSIKYILDCITGTLIKKSRIKITTVTLPISILSQIKLGMPITIDGHTGIVSNIHCNTKLLKVEIKSCSICPQEVSSTTVDGYCNEEYTTDHFISQQYIEKTKTGLEIHMPIHSNINTFTNIYSTLQSSKEADTEILYCEYPTHEIHNIIEHNIHVKFHQENSQ